MSKSWRALATALALASLAATTWLFIRETRPFSASRPATAQAHLSDSDLRAFSAPIDYAGAVPVLNFHDISTRGGALSVTPSTFANQMAALRRAGFETVSLAQVRDLVLGRRPALPHRPILITFDDAVETQYSRADPILAANHFRAVAFVDVTRLGDGRKPSYYLSWPQLRTLSRSHRWDFGIRAETGTPDPLKALTGFDSSTSVAKLTRATGSAPYALSYPVTASALPTKPRALARIRRAVGHHFTLGFVSDLRSPRAVDAHSDPLLLPRFEVTSSVDVQSLARSLRLMVPSPPGRTVSAWGLSGGACAVGNDGVAITAPAYALCRSQLNGGQWTDYRVSMSAAGLTGKSTLVVLCRAGADGQVELSIGSRLAVLRQLVGARYSTLGSWPTLPPGPGGTHSISIDVVGTSASVVVDGATLGTAHIDRRLAAGPPGLGIAGGGTVTLTAVTATDLRSKASPQ